MASRRVDVAAVTQDALQNEDIRRVVVPSRVNAWVSCVTNTDQWGLRLDNTVIMDNGPVNIEIAADVIDTDRDQLVFDTIVGRGQLRAPVPALTTELQFLLSVEPLL